MSCLLIFLATCVFEPSNVYVSGDIDFAASPHRFANGLWEGRWCQDRFCTGPVGTFRLGVEVKLPNGWQLDYGVKHVSTITTGRDRGTESPYVSLTWRPFR